MPGLHRLPGDAPERDTNLEPGDLITAIELAPGPARSAYRKVRERASFSFAVVSIAAAVDVRDGVVAECRIAIGGVAHVPWRAEAAETALRGKPATPEAFAAAADAELAAAQPLRDNAYKVALARNVLVNTLTELCA
jgi:xanthine dehydrogenase YagS FAD-binding subunit